MQATSKPVTVNSPVITDSNTIIERGDTIQFPKNISEHALFHPDFDPESYTKTQTEHTTATIVSTHVGGSFIEFHAGTSFSDSYYLPKRYDVDESQRYVIIDPEILMPEKLPITISRFKQLVEHDILTIQE